MVHTVPIVFNLTHICIGSCCRRSLPPRQRKTRDTHKALFATCNNAGKVQALQGVTLRSSFMDVWEEKASGSTTLVALSCRNKQMANKYPSSRQELRNGMCWQIFCRYFLLSSFFTTSGLSYVSKAAPFTSTQHLGWFLLKKKLKKN